MRLQEAYPARWSFYEFLYHKRIIGIDTAMKSKGTKQKRASFIKLGMVDVDVRISSHLRKSWFGLQINGFRLIIINTIILF